jgi:hypothetical protein
MCMHKRSTQCHVLHLIANALPVLQATAFSQLASTVIVPIVAVADIMKDV